MNLNVRLKRITVEDSGKGAAYDLGKRVFTPNLALIASTLKAINEVVQYGQLSGSMMVSSKQAKGSYKLELQMEANTVPAVYKLDIEPQHTTETLNIADQIVYKLQHTPGAINYMEYQPTSLAKVQMPKFAGIIGDNSNNELLDKLMLTVRGVLKSQVVNPCVQCEQFILPMYRCTSLEEVMNIPLEHPSLVTFPAKINHNIYQLFTSVGMAEEEKWVGTAQQEVFQKQLQMLYDQIAEYNITIPLDGIFFAALREQRIGNMETAVNISILDL